MEPQSFCVFLWVISSEAMTMCLQKNFPKLAFCKANYGSTFFPPLVILVLILQAGKGRCPVLFLQSFSELSMRAGLCQPADIHLQDLALKK